jgi:predicted RNA-binding Zn ribbon-like protein
MEIGVNVVEDEDLLVALLNSAPVVAGGIVDDLRDGRWDGTARRWGGTGSADEQEFLRRVRDALHAIVRGQADPVGTLEPLLEGSTMHPVVTPTGIRWTLDAPMHQKLGMRAVAAWSEVGGRLSGRLRACANTECNLFLIDHSRPGTARWCSMATCGNRAKVRAHARQRRADLA